MRYCKNCYCPYYVSSLAIKETDEVIEIVIPDAIYHNGQEIYLHIAQPIPDDAGTKPVIVMMQDGSVMYPLVGYCGNYVRVDTLRTNFIYALRVGTDPGHFNYIGRHRLPHTSYPTPTMSVEDTDK